MPNKLNVNMPENLNQELEDVSEKTGLSKSEITRRGILEQVRELE